ncbi:uncharacterized protein BX664DRAFT_321113 [Halteromyces radiatus]|uniref:uncharacterized protein n=1 Tax=Halteromyces radiatus TaxID=101107 RepID=UPI00221F6A0C|nr:uncharacterized protein BX664DRAFT_321113 [Halteromyces radiatus]KAI8099375.1 hypothetical protein BX664DRAFT_321113 [Halteromyces radiatus]
MGDLFCIRDRLPLSLSPLIIFTIVLVFYTYLHRKAKHNASNEQFAISVKYRKWIQLVLIPIELIGWLYLYIHENDYCNAYPIAFAFIFAALFVITAASPSALLFSQRHYIFFFFTIYALFFVHAIYILFEYSGDSLLYLIWSNLAITLVLTTIHGTTSLPINPINLEALDSEKVEIKNGQIYRNDLLLCPEAQASIFSWACFQWVNSLVVFGYKNPVKRNDIYALTYNHLARFTYKEFVDTKKWIARKKVLRRIYSANKGSIWTQFICSITAVMVSYLNPFFQQKFLEYIENPNGRPIKTAYAFILGMFVVSLTKLLFNSIQLYAGRRWNVRTICMLDAEIYEKTLKRKDMSGKVDDEKDGSSEESVSSTGKITNLMSLDADRVGDLPAYIFNFYNAPVELVIAITYLYHLLGVAAFVGLGVMILFFPVTLFLLKRIGDNYEALTHAKDRRNELVNELLQGIRMIKYFAWEPNWNKRVHDARKSEVNKLIWVVIYDVLLNVAFLSIPVLVTASSFVWYTKVSGNKLTASVVFVSITLFDMLRAPIILIPDCFTTLTECYISLKRIVNYLEEPEVGDGVDNPPMLVPEGKSVEQVIARIGFEKSVFKWHSGNPTDIKEQDKSSTTTPTDSSTASSSSNNDNEETTLAESVEPVTRSFSLNVPAFDFPLGELSIVCGPTGSGKSSFLHALLGEMDIVSGRVFLPSKNNVITDEPYSLVEETSGLRVNEVAYVAQQPYLQHASIRDNILFGQPFDPVRYKKVLRQCALIKDLNVFTDGDQTEIGEKGISLSGGQKQRVSLARAVYSHAKTILLDDCLSAVDSHTAKHIFRHCITGDLLKDRTIILVTHHVRLCLPGAHYLVKLENGFISGYGLVDDLKKTGQLVQLLGEEAIIDLDGKLIDDDSGDGSLNDEEEDYDINKETAINKLIAEEESAKGHVKYDVYKTYLAACGGWPFWLLLIACYIVSRFFTFAENWWLRIWAAAYSTPIKQQIVESGQTVFGFTTFQTLRNVVQEINVDYYIGIYLLLCLSFVIFDTLRSALLYWGSIRGARILFDSMLARIIHAPMRFFDTTPIGRILNRFGKDVTTVDLRMARSASFLLECVTGLVQSILVISLITPQFLIVAVLISGVYFLIGTYYLRISRELKRLNSVSRSPIYSHFTESLVGVTTIRAFGQQKKFLLTMYDKLDTYVAPFYLLWMTNRWLYCRMEFTGAFLTLSAGVFIVLNLDRVDAGMAGISLFYAFSFLENVYWFIRQYTQVEMDLNSVERVQEYLQIDQEAPSVVEGRRPPAAWPTTAAIEVKDLEIRYAPELDTVIRGISFDVKPHEKVAIVGRTASGKSTLALSFFRFLEPSAGSIIMDGIDISHIGLQDLRSKITIIPQEAVLFSGTVRSNLDPFGEHDDAELWESLVRSNLSTGNHGTSSPKKQQASSSSSQQDLVIDESSASNNVIYSLDQQVSDGGNNFSQGQRQLLCLARALLKNSKLIIMDEATASVDFETDAKIQHTIRQEFSDSTLICIAHRIRTIIDYDKVLVLDHGKLVENDSPYALLQNTNGVFRSMCEKSGELDILLEMAEKSQGRDFSSLVMDDHSLVK